MLLYSTEIQYEEPLTEEQYDEGEEQGDPKVYYPDCGDLLEETQEDDYWLVDEKDQAEFESGAKAQGFTPTYYDHDFAVCRFPEHFKKI